jgi:hypothetical protein
MSLPSKIFTDPTKSATNLELGRRAGLNDFTVIHDADTARQGHRFLLIVRDDHEGDAELVLQADEFELRMLAQFLVECSQRLVEQQELRAFDQRPCERHTLFLAAGQLMRLALGEPAEFYQIQHRCHAFRNLRPRHAILLQAESDVLFHGHVREQRV